MASRDPSASFSLDQENLRVLLLELDSQLGAQDVESLKFLCLGLVSKKKLEEADSALDIFELLLARELVQERNTFFLAELLYIIKQIKLLQHLGYSKGLVECLLPTRGKVPLFRKMLYDLSEGISADTLNSMKFLLGESLPKSEMDSLKFLDYLEKQGKIRENDLTFLEELCKKVSPCLTRIIEKYIKEKAAVDKETELLQQEEEEIISQSDIEQFNGALPATVYRMDQKHRGHCVIINNEIFAASLSNRHGTQKDVECLTQVFQWLEFTVSTYNNQTKKALEALLQQEKQHPDHEHADCFVFCVLTHGEFGAVYSSDAALIPIREIVSQFTAQQCPGLAGKPKLFFIQACQGEGMQPAASIQTDAVNPECVTPSLWESIPDEADFLLGLATVPGYASVRHVKNGSWYIQSLCEHLKALVPRGEDILSILTAVNNDVSQQKDRSGKMRQMPQPAFTLRKRLIFPVPQEQPSS